MSTITVRKFWDKYGDGVWDMANEPEIGKDGVINPATNICVKDDGTTDVCGGDFGGWPITITEPAPPLVVPAFTPYFEDAAQKGTWKICEDDSLAGWGQTAAYTSQDISALGVNLYPNDPDPGVNCVEVEVGDPFNENHVVVFGNTHLLKLIVITCDTVTETLIVSEVNMDLDNDNVTGGGELKTTIAAPPALAPKDAAELHTYLCALVGASYDNLPADTYGLSRRYLTLGPPLPGTQFPSYTLSLGS